jgi:hypothetical protein
MAGLSKEPLTTVTTEIRARPTNVAQSPRDETSSVGIVRKIIAILIIVGSCRIRRKEMVPTNLRINLMVMVRPLMFPVILMVMLSLFLLHVFLEIMNGYLILLLHFIFVVTKGWFSSYEFVQPGDFCVCGR